MGVQRAVLAEGACWTDSRSCIVAGVVSALLLLLALALAKGGNASWPVALVLGVALSTGGVTACVAVQKGKAFVQSMMSTPVSSRHFRIASDPTPRNGSYRCRATAIGSDGHSGDVWLTLPQSIGQGSYVRCVGRFEPNGDDEWGVSSRRQGVWGSVRVVRIMEEQEGTWANQQIQSLRQRILGMLDPGRSAERSLLAGCVCGWREGLAEFGLDEAFSSCGLSHLVAVSGSHLAILSALLAGVMESLRLRPHTRIAMLLVATGSFVLLCGSPNSAIRSWIMTCAAMAGRVGGRRSHALSAVCVAGLCMALLNPGVSGQLGFALSVSAVVGLCLLSAYATYALNEVLENHVPPRWMPRGVSRAYLHVASVCKESLAASMVAQASTMPFAIEAFGKVSLVGPLASMVVTPPFSIMLGITMVGIACWWAPHIQAAILAVADVLAHVLLSLVGLFGSMPFATVLMQEHTCLVAGIVGSGLALLLVAWPHVSGKCVRMALVAICAVLCVQVLLWRFFAPARVCILDVGQGDAVLVQQGASAILVDAGPDKSVAEALTRKHVLHLDAIVVTHMHDDHYAGISSLQGKVSCDRVIIARGVASHISQQTLQEWRALTGSDVCEIAFGDVLCVGSFYLTMIWPATAVDGSQNSDSIELRLDYEEADKTLHALLTGDAEKDETGSVLASGLVGDIDLLKVGHHGSEVSLTHDQAESLDPEVAVASAGQNNHYGHPSKACVQVLEDSGALFLCTKDVGDVEVTPAKGGVVVSAQREVIDYP
ncbi:MAG: ComEC/Rec2 family competence protein [Coriobacteriales bacterium]|nr:ComEC/Rec2 family competence protein [Coriobacteriales bacterium]